MKRMKGMTGRERTIFWCAMNNLAQEVAYRVRRFNEADGLKPSIEKRREREMFQAIERLAESYNSGISDAALRFWAGPAAVRERDQRLSSEGCVLPMKRGGLIVRPLRRSGLDDGGNKDG